MMLSASAQCAMVMAKAPSWLPPHGNGNGRSEAQRRQGERRLRYVVHIRLRFGCHAIASRIIAAKIPKAGSTPGITSTSRRRWACDPPLSIGFPRIISTFNGVGSTGAPTPRYPAAP